MDITIILRNLLAFLISTLIAIVGVRFLLSTYDYEHDQSNKRVHATNAAIQNKNN